LSLAGGVDMLSGAGVVLAEDRFDVGFDDEGEG
jgi:hypothetical protein